ncbi:putative isomerase YbhE [Clavulina sp. PMI_390]|nr:putative isomerase YbhE [Clavulina sp. PMI_390]
MTTYRILVSSYAGQISTLDFNPEAGTLTVAGVTKTGPAASWMELHPSDPSLLYVTNEVPNGMIQVFRLTNQVVGLNVKLELLAERSAGGADPASFALLEDQIVIGNYSGGNLVPIPISKQEPYFLEPKQPPLNFTGSGPNKSRQESSHPHQVIIHGEELLIPDLGADKLLRLKQVDGKWEVAGAVSFEAGTGPRHIVVYNGVLYTGLELVTKISSHKFPSNPHDEVIHLSTLSTLPEGASPTPDMLLAEVLLTPTTPEHPDPLIYVTNRNEPLPAGDTIAVFAPHSPDDAGKPFRYLGAVATGLQHLRAISLGGPSSRYLIAGGVNGGGVKVFERTGETLKEIASAPEVEKPTSFVWL